MQRLALLIPFLLAIPLALFLGIALSTPDTYMSLGLVGLCLAILALPAVIRWHEILLIFSWSAPIEIFFVPGQMKLWMLMSFLSLCVGVISDGVSGKPDRPPYGRWSGALSFCLLLLTAVVFVTAEAQGGLGSRALGSEMFGGRKYYAIFFAVLGFYALRRIQISDKQRWVYVGLFFGGTVLSMASNLIYAAGPRFYWLFAIFPVDFAYGQAAADYGKTSIMRLAGVAFGTMGPMCYLLARHGIRGVFSFKHPFRFALFVSLFGLITLGGFRSLLALALLVLLVQFIVEGLFNFRTLATFVAGCALFYAVAIPFAKHLPQGAQRTLSIVPLIEVDPVVRVDAEGSTQWRLRMWDALLAEVPKYLWLGKGYAMDPNLHAIAMMGGGDDFDALMMAGDYHSGPFSVLISFGIPGVIAVLLLWAASIALLHRNLTRGGPELRAINLFLYGYYITRVLFFTAIFGDISSDTAVFTGIVGLSIALNRPKPVAKSAPAQMEAPNAEPAKLEPAKVGAA